jgi:tetratricopeptide (TPR) repeat protein
MKKPISYKSTKKASVSAPTSSEVNALAALYNQQNYPQAAEVAKDIIARFPQHGFGWKVLGAVLQAQGLIDESLDAKQKAADLSPKDAEAWSNLGNAYQDKNRLDDALKCLKHAIQISPNLAVAHNNLGITFEKLNRLDDAQSCYQKALDLRPDYVEAHYNYGVTLQKMARYDDAQKSYRLAINYNPNHAKAHSNLGLVLKHLSQFTESEKHFLIAIKLDPGFIDAHYNFALLLMLLGRLKEGWAQYQWFYHPQNTNPSKPNQPNLKAKQWQGEMLQDKTILIHSEQGFGDMIQFVRYAQHLKSHGATVWVLVTKPLVELFNTIEWVDCVLENGEQHKTTYDFWVFPLALPYWFQTTLETLPCNVPYLSVNFEKRAWWQNWFTQYGVDGNKKIGLVWAGNPVHSNDVNRSIDLSQFACLSVFENITWVSLQLGEKARSQCLNSSLNMLDASAYIEDFTDTAGLLENLDLLISVDSSPAHLAGALNVPVWTLITAVPDWRWLLDREDSVWYKSMRLFRQPEKGDWTSVLQDVKNALEVF